MTSGTGRFFVIEGSDATGKSTLGARLGAERFTTFVECPPEPLGGIKAEVFKSLDPLARLLYFISGNAQLSSIADRVGTGNSLVGVRYIWSTIAYHSAIEGMEVATTLSILESALPRLTMPESVIFLTVQEPVQKRRMAERGELIQGSPAETAKFEARLSDCFREAFELLPVPVITMDTSETTVDGLAASLRPVLWAD